MGAAIGLQVLVVTMMLAVGFDLAPADLVRGSRPAGWLAAAAVANLVMFPAVTWMVMEVLQPGPGLAAGFLLCAAAPAGPVGPAMARLARADMGYSITVMLLLGVVGLVTTPVTSALLIARTGDGLFVPMFVALLLFQILPLAVAMAVRAVSASLAAALARPFRAGSNVLLAVIVIALVATRGELLVTIEPAVHMAVAGLTSATVAGVGWMAPPGSRLRGLLIVTSFRNISVALLLASRLFDDPAVEAAVLVWAFWMIVIPATAATVAGRKRTIGAGQAAARSALGAAPSPDQAVR